MYLSYPQVLMLFIWNLHIFSDQTCYAGQIGLVNVVEGFCWASPCQNKAYNFLERSKPTLEV